MVNTKQLLMLIRLETRILSRYEFCNHSNSISRARYDPIMRQLRDMLKGTEVSWYILLNY